MKKERTLDWPFIILLYLAPLIIVVLLFIAAGVARLFRYDPAYFEEYHLRRYDTPGSIATGLERALSQGDTTLMAELQATRFDPAPLEARPNLVFSYLIDIEAGYYNYLYWDTSDFRRVAQRVHQVQGRYVVSPEDLNYWMSSGRWQEVAGPIAVLWWLTLSLTTAVMWVYRHFDRERRRIYSR